MQDALINFFNFIKTELITPIYNALSQSSIFTDLFDFLSKLIQSFFKLWNNDNSIDVYVDLINKVFSQVLGVLFFVLIIKLSISIVNVFISTIKGVLK